MGRMMENPLYPLIRDFLSDDLADKRNCSPHTVKAYRTALNQLLEFTKNQKHIRLAEITFDTLDENTVTAYLDDLESSKNCSIRTRNYRLNCLRAFYSYAAMTDAAYVVYQLDINRIPFKKEEQADIIEYLSEKAVKTLLEQPDISTKNGIRTVPLMQETVAHYERYLHVFHKGEPPYSGQSVFYTIRKGIRNPISDDTVRVFMNEYAKAAHTVCAEVPERVHPHIWRHSRAMHLYQHGMDLTLLSQWLGHASLSTTLIYAHANTEMKRKAIEKATNKYFPPVVTTNTPYDVSDDTVLKRLYGLI